MAGAPAGALRVATGDGREKTDGVYVLTDVVVNGLPCWKRESGGRWLYASPTVWTITDDPQHFQTGWGFVVSGRHRGELPEQMVKWKGVEEGGEWKVLAGMRVETVSHIPTTDISPPPAPDALTTGGTPPAKTAEAAAVAPPAPTPAAGLPDTAPVWDPNVVHGMSPAAALLANAPGYVPGALLQEYFPAPSLHPNEIAAAAFAGGTSLSPLTRQAIEYEELRASAMRNVTAAVAVDPAQEVRIDALRTQLLEQRGVAMMNTSLAAAAAAAAAAHSPAAAAAAADVPGREAFYIRSAVPVCAGDCPTPPLASKAAPVAATAADVEAALKKDVYDLRQALHSAERAMVEGEKAAAAAGVDPTAAVQDVMREQVDAMQRRLAAAEELLKRVVSDDEHSGNKFSVNNEEADAGMKADGAARGDTAATQAGGVTEQPGTAAPTDAPETQVSDTCAEAVAATEAATAYEPMREGLVEEAAVERESQPAAQTPVAAPPAAEVSALADASPLPVFATGVAPWQADHVSPAHAAKAAALHVPQLPRSPGMAELARSVEATHTAQSQQLQKSLDELARRREAATHDAAALSAASEAGRHTTHLLAMHAALEEGKAEAQIADLRERVARGDMVAKALEVERDYARELVASKDKLIDQLSQALVESKDQSIVLKTQVDGCSSDADKWRNAAHDILNSKVKLETDLQGLLEAAELRASAAERKVKELEATLRDETASAERARVDEMRNRRDLQKSREVETAQAAQIAQLQREVEALKTLFAREQKLRQLEITRSAREVHEQARQAVAAAGSPRYANPSPPATATTHGVELDDDLPSRAASPLGMSLHQQRNSPHAAPHGGVADPRLIDSLTDLIRRNSNIMHDI